MGDNTSNVDRCTIPAAEPPEGEVSDFSDAGTLVPAAIAVGAFMMALALIITGGRLYAHRRQLMWSDYCCTAALVFAITETSLMFFQLRLARHQWNIPVCWLLGDTVKLRFGRSLITIMATVMAKTSIFLLLHEVFTLERGMRIAIWIGMAATYVVAIVSFVSQCLDDIPRQGKTWDDVALKFNHMVVWSPAASILYMLLDVYMFLLPIPVVARLNWPTRKRLKALAVFSTGFLAVIATAVSLVYRIRLWEDSPDKTWKSGIVLLCSVVELHITIIVSSMPGFSKFVRVYWASNRPRILKSSSEDSSQLNAANAPRGHRDRQQYLELGESWLFRTNATAEEPADNNPGPRPATASGAIKGLDPVSRSCPDDKLPDNVLIVRGISGDGAFGDGVFGHGVFGEQSEADVSKEVKL